MFLEPISDTGGLHFPTAIFQLVIGLYCLEGCLLGLFLASATNPLSIWLALMMFFAVVLTGIFHYRIRSVFNPVIKYIPISLYQFQPSDDQQETHIKSKYNIPQSHNRHESIRSASKILFETTNRFVPRKHSQTFSNLSDSSRFQRSGNEFTNTNQLQTTKTKTNDSVEKKEVKPMNVIDTLTDEQREYITKSAFNHYSLREFSPCIWIPQDNLGISDDQINEIRLNYPHIFISNHGCILDLKGNISIYDKPPDWNPYLNL